MSEQPQQQPERREQQETTEMSPLDQAFLHASRLRMVGEETSSVGAGMTADVMGHAGLAEMVQQVTAQLSTAADEIAGRMEQDLHTLAEQEREDEEPPHDG